MLGSVVGGVRADLDLGTGILSTHNLTLTTSAGHMMALETAPDKAPAVNWTAKDGPPA